MYDSGDVHVEAILLPVDIPKVLVLVHIDRVLLEPDLENLSFATVVRRPIQSLGEPRKTS